MRARHEPLSGISHVFNGKTPAKGDQRDFGHPVLKIRDIDDSGQFRGAFASFVDLAYAKGFQSKCVKAGDTLILNAAHNAEYVGSKQFFAGHDVDGALATGEWLIVRPEKDIADPRYVHFWLTSAGAKRQIRDMVKGIHLYPKDVARAEIPLPALPEQRRIAAVLDKADELRRKRKRAIELLDGLTQSIFLEMFGDPNTNPLRLTKMPLGDLIRVKSGNGLVAKDMAPNGRHPVYGGNGINGHHDRYMFEESKVVLGRVGVYCGAVHVTKPMSWVTDNALYVSEIKRPMSLTYLAAALKEANLNQYAGRAAQPLISGSRVYPVEILTPSLDDQLTFEKSVDRIHKVRAEQSHAHLHAKALFSSLQLRAFSGDIL